jgi:hypothetical protein
MKLTNGPADGGKFRNLEKILWTWVKLNERFFSQKRDGSWWYNERASISVLAAAAWMTGGVALEEFFAKKKQKGREHAGRTDVYLKMGKSEFACEAKFMWLSAKSTNAISRIEKTLKEACDNAEENDKSGKLLGVCFVTVYVAERNVAEFGNLIEELQNKICSELEFDAIAWSFPAKAREELKGEKDKRLHPGSFLILRSCD